MKSVLEFVGKIIGWVESQKLETSTTIAAVGIEDLKNMKKTTIRFLYPTVPNGPEMLIKKETNDTLKL